MMKRWECRTKFNDIVWSIANAIRSAHDMDDDDIWFDHIDKQIADDKEILDAYENGFRSADLTPEFMQDTLDMYNSGKCLKDAYINRNNKEYKCQHCENV